MRTLFIDRARATIQANAVKIGSGLLIGTLLLWLFTSESNPWSSASYVASVTELMTPEELRDLENDITPFINIADPAGKVNINKSWQRNALNIYVVSSEKLLGWSTGGASYFPRHDVVLIDKNAVWPYITRSLYVSTDTLLTRHSKNYDGLWRQFILLHELGHRLMHRAVNPATLLDQKARRRHEDEADAFAFEQLARRSMMFGVGIGDPSKQSGLFNRRNFVRLPEPDRAAAVIASLIQEFSVNLLFSNAAVSTFDSDIAHKAFVDRFKPRLSELLSKTTTREGRTYVLIALATIERVESAGRNIVAEIVSEHPIAEAQFSESDLEIKVLLPPATSNGVGSLKLGSFHVPRTSLSSPTAIKMRLAPGSAIQESSTGKADNAEGNVDCPDCFPDVIEAMRAQRTDKPQRDWWPDRRDAKRPNIQDLVSQIDELYSHVFDELIGQEWKLSCRLQWRVREYPNLDVLIPCGDNVFSGQYNVESGKIWDVNELQGFHDENSRRSLATQAKTIKEIVDVRIDDQRRIYFLEDTLSDQAHVNPHQIRVWLASAYPPRLVGMLDFITDWIPTGSSIDKWFEISHPPVMTCQAPTEEVVICTEFLDSIFKIDLKTGKIGVLFYPAGVRQAWDEKEYYVLYARGGFRLFIARVP